MAGIEEVAKLAGVSTATVSRALSGKDHVSAKALAAVQLAASELGYVVSHSAYTLATGRNRNIGVVMPRVDRWFFSTVLEAAETELISNGYDLTLYNLRGGDNQRSQVFQEFLLRGRVDAVLAVAIQPDKDEIAALDRLGKPIVGIGGIIPGARTIEMDDFAAGKLATEHLISLGHTKIANLSGEILTNWEFNQPGLRRAGYLEALKNAGIESKEAWQVMGDYSIPSGYRAAKQLLGDPRNAPTALFCNSDEMAIGAILAAKDLGLRVPQDVSIIGIDDHDFAEFFGVTTITQTVSAQATFAVRTILDLLSDPDLGSHVNVDQNTVWPSELIVRSTTARVNS
jgi:LacI family transcriptional regulator, repressor for deo operon, udp, cdd, tsx, nupC, and nupG